MNLSSVKLNTKKIIGNLFSGNNKPLTELIYAPIKPSDEFLNKRFKLAIEARDIEQIKYILSQSKNIDVEIISNGYTPLMIAVLENNIELLKSLITYGAYLNQVVDEKSALSLSVDLNRFSLAFELISAKAFVSPSILKNIILTKNLSAVKFLKSINYDFASTKIDKFNFLTYSNN